MERPTSNRVVAIALIALTLATLALRLWGIGYGVPVWEEPDPDVPGHVDLIHSGVTFAGVEHPEQQYPHVVADIARWMPQRPDASGLKTVEEHLAAAAHTHVMVRIVVALIATLLVPLTFALARRFASAPWSLLAAALVTASLLHQSFAQQARPHGVAASLFALALLTDLAVVRSGSWRAYFAAGVALALALGTLHSAVALALAGLVAHALRAGSARKFVDLKLAVPVVLACLAFVLFYPFLFGLGLISEPDRLALEDGNLRFAEHALSLTQFQGRGFVVIARVLWSYEPLLTLLLPLALLGWLAGRVRERDRVQRAERTVVLAFVVPYLLAIGLFELTYERFFLPLIPFAAVFVAVGFEAAARRVGSLALRRAAIATVACALALPLAACVKLAWLRARPDTLDEAAAWIAKHAPRERVWISASQPLDLPLFREPEGFKPFGAKQLTPWTRWQIALPAANAPAPRFDLRWLAAPPRGRTLSEHIASLGPALIVVEPYEQRAGHPLLTELSRAVAEHGQCVERLSPDRDPQASDLELFFQLSDHYNEPGESVAWPNFTWRVLRARAIGPVLELWRIPG